ncbi:hypothetical protein [Vibrio viridaestus]|uniref:Uncharacterized protein n=1 Tax=Vibrio viridaestus TaxID=2487322 RepID=A0A3N9TDD5_9VIBR|nr:hypothetical protein [Vibrio viridaestus]RQW62208.1 hypothetical protein EES38_15950 [Vibrio viridaestus]
MNRLLACAALSTALFSVGSFAAGVSMNVETVGNNAYVQVKNGDEPMSNVPVTVTNGTNTQVVTTAEDGHVLVSNFDSISHSYTFTVDAKNGQDVSETRFLSKAH